MCSNGRIGAERCHTAWAVSAQCLGLPTSIHDTLTIKRQDRMAPATQRAAALAGCAAVAGTAFVALPASQSERTAAPALRGQSATASSTATGQSFLNAAGVALGGSAAAVAARRLRKETAASQRTVVCAFENELGVQAPVGFWDPAGFTTDGDSKEFFRRRVVELKHGRVSMLACTGYIIQEFFRFPGYLSPSSEIKFADIPNGLAAVTKVPAVGWFQYTIFCGLCDLWLANQAQTNPPGKLGTRFWGEGSTNYSYGFLGVRHSGCTVAANRRARGKNWELALAYLSALVHAALEANEVSYNTAISACEKGACWEPAPRRSF
ncbi:Fucoxanthin-chlorophyll a-c binding protein A, chloroplastic [Symbiodinium microadriaticum]|uniref:Fucoxanthin-chlorophyll a-c binding protein A, chloroplastic n=1 Tax=Symbiodinium microadriaticum TaxID=2951 RepID=A0A1Q9D708_SYMMI|nr:Fucoxanthin-chlorophyll a-c binding protein A, chloroplastic [Symbiodinium microadriaticum]